MNPALALFSNELIMYLENEHREAAKGTWALLRMTNDYAIQPILTITTSKCKKIKEAMILLL